MEPMTTAAIVGGAAKVLGGLLSDRSSEKAAHINADLQREFAQHGIQWKVEDARRSGIHPLYALGAQTHSASPVAVGTNWDLGDMGQDISRAISATSNADQKADRLGAFIDQKVALQEARDQQKQMFEYQLENARVNNLLLWQRFWRESQGGQVGPVFPSATGSTTGVQGMPENVQFGPNAGLSATNPGARTDAISFERNKIPSAMSNDPGVQAGVAPARQEFRGPYGLPVRTTSERLSEILENEGIPGQAKAWLINALGAVEDLGRWWTSGTPARGAAPPEGGHYFYQRRGTPFNRSFELVNERKGR